ncbi:MAG: hypothetical protein ACKV2V_16595 [Blastocatellia bacterium]
MSGMKFRCQCSGCNATFFSPDRRARYCPKCIKKREGAAAAARSVVPGEARERRADGGERRPGGDGERRFGGSDERGPSGPRRFGGPPGHQPGRKPPGPPKEKKTPVKKATELTPELRERIWEIYQQKFAGAETPWKETVGKISAEVWVKTNMVSLALRDKLFPLAEATPEQCEKIIAQYRAYVESGERPARGRRRTISDVTGVPYLKVRSVLYLWMREQYAQSPTPDPTREQLFAIEKAYWEEIKRRRWPMPEFPARIAEQLGFTTTMQVGRWLDQLHNDGQRYARAEPVAPEMRERIIAAYQAYLAAPQPPGPGLHRFIADEIGGLTPRQVHGVLNEYRLAERAAYPLR